MPKEKKPSEWYSGALEVLGPLRWHLNELIEEMESYNRLAKAAGRPLLAEKKIVVAKEANDKADKYFGCPIICSDYPQPSWSTAPDWRDKCDAQRKET
jgi:hypothetical protein